MDAAAAKEAFWAGVVEHMPMIVLGLVTLVGAVISLAVIAVNRLANRLKPAVVEAVAEVERTRRYDTPVNKQSAAEGITRNRLGRFTSSIIPRSAFRAEIDHAVAAANAVQRAKSDPPPPLPRRPSGEFAGLDMSAIEGIHDHVEPSDDDA